MVKDKCYSYTELSDDENLRIFYQVMSNGKNKFPMHKDKNRVLAYNYILETGGNDVRTNIYDDNKNLLESKCLPAHRWHSIQVNRYHDLTNLPKESRRVAVTMHSYIQ